MMIAHHAVARPDLPTASPRAATSSVLRSPRLAAAVFLCACLTAKAAPAQFEPIVNGAQEVGEPTTAALLYGDTQTGYVTCSAVMIGCDSAITTAHCFNQNPQLKTWLYFQHVGYREIESATRHPAYAEALATYPPDLFDILRVEDIAFIKLMEPVAGITPATLPSGAPPLPGTAGRIVGFGRDPITQTSAGSVDQNPGIKRSGSMEIDACTGSLAGEDVLCWEPPVPQGPTGEDASTCDGDSGGPLFIDEAGTRVVAGLTKGHIIVQAGQSDLCEPPVLPFDTSVYRHRDWIGGSDGAGGMVSLTGAMPLSIKNCTATPQLADDSPVASLGSCDGSAWAPGETTRVCGFEGFLDGGLPTLAYQFDVPAGTVAMHVGFNGVASPGATVDTNYYLRAGAPATQIDFDCASNGTGTVGYCAFDSPSAVTWHVLVDQTLYQGEHQVTVSLWGPQAAGEVPAVRLTGRLLLVGLLAGVPTALWRRERGGQRLRPR